MLRRILRLFRPRNPLPDLQPPPDWTAEDAERLRVFLAGETGLKFVAVVRRLTTTTALAAMHADQSKLRWQCGFAAGVQGTAENIDQLARWQEQAAEPAKGVPTDDLEWMHERKQRTSS